MWCMPPSCSVCFLLHLDNLGAIRFTGEAVSRCPTRGKPMVLIPTHPGTANQPTRQPLEWSGPVWTHSHSDTGNHREKLTCATVAMETASSVSVMF